MITEATLYLATDADADAALLRVGGRPIAYRALVAAVRAGCRRVGVSACFQGTDVDRALAVDPQARAATVWLGDETPPPDGPSLFVPAAALVHVADLQEIVRAEPVTVLAPLGAAAPIVAADACLTAALWPDARRGRPLGATLQSRLEAGPQRQAVSRWYVHVTSPRAAREAEARLYEDMGTATDTPLDAKLHRRLSLPLSRLAIAAGLTPNQVSLLGLVVGLLAVWGFAHGTPAGAILGLLLYFIAAVLDHCDGEIARLTLSESRLGEWLDVVTDTVIHGSLMLAMGATAQGAAGRGALGLGVLAALGAAASAMVAKTSPRGRRGGLGGFLDALGTRDGFYALLILFILALCFAPPLLLPLMIVAAIGSHGYWLTRLVHKAFTRPLRPAE